MPSPLTFDIIHTILLMEKIDIKCQDCGHDIDNHSYKGCLVKDCKCRIRPREIVVSKNPKEK